MSGPALLYVASLAMSGKAVVDGIKEGNLAKAALGGIGGYMAMSGLGTLNAAAGEAGNATAAAVSDRGTEAAGKLAEAAAPSVTQAATAEPSMWTIEKDALGGNLSAANSSSNYVNLADTTGFAPSVSSKPGFLSRIGDWANKNQLPAYGAMQLGGAALSGYAQGEVANEELKEARRMEAQRRADEEARRNRIGTQASTGFLKRYRYDPMVGNMVEVPDGNA